jgi:hypothetical protein
MCTRIILAVATALILSTPAAWADGALAVGDGGNFGVSRNHPGQHRAERVALENCSRGSTGCRIVLNFEHACAAYAHSRNGHQGWAARGNEHRARHEAVDACENHGGRHCEIRTVQCDGL